MEVLKKKKIGSDFSGVGAFNMALKRLNTPYEEVFACDMDKYARRTFILNHGQPNYFPENVYNRDIPENSLDIYMTSPPCQSFSLAGKRKGENDDRGVLFYNSHEFIKTNKPRFFIFENVKGLLSDDTGKTFQRWIDFLGGKSVNGTQVMFPHEESVPYHVYYKVLNAKDYNIAQNRERIFIVGIRDDIDNVFTWSKELNLTKRLKDYLETFETSDFHTQEEFNAYMEKYYLSVEMQEKLVLKETKDKLGFINQDTQASQVYKTEGLMPNISAGTHGYSLGYIECIGNINSSQDRQVFSVNGISQCLSAGHCNSPKILINSATSKGYEEATENDSINFTHPNSKTRRGRVGVGVAQTLDTQCNQGILQINPCKESGGKQPYQQNRVYDSNGISPTIDTGAGRWSVTEEICVPVLTPDRVEKRQNGRRFKENGEEMFTITTQDRHGVYDGIRIRKLTPKECFRLMDFDDTFKWDVSDAQAYKQAGNSICVGVLVAIISRLKL